MKELHKLMVLNLKLLLLLNDALDACWQKLNQIQQSSFPDFGFSGIDRIYKRDEIKEKAAKEAELIKLAAIEAEKQKQKEAIAARDEFLKTEAD